MSSFPLLHAALRMARGAGSAWDVCNGLVAATNDAGRDVVAVLHPAHFLVHQLRQSVVADRLFLHAPEFIRELTDTDVGIVASDRDRDVTSALKVWPDLERRWSARLRRLDTLYSASHDIGLLIIGAADPLAILSGAPTLLVHHAPIILLDLGAIPPSGREVALATCAERLLGYDWRDSFLFPCRTPLARMKSLHVLAETVFCALPARSDIPMPPGDDKAVFDTHVAGVAWQGWKVPLPTQQWPTTFYPMDEHLPCGGFYGIETDGTHVWRWSGPAPRATLYIPVPGPGQWSIKLNVFAWGRTGAPGDIEVFVDRYKTAIVHQDAYGMCLAHVNVPVGRHCGYLSVDIIVAQMTHASAQDRRLIGICLFGFSVEQVS